jgi:hypothetical protein
MSKARREIFLRVFQPLGLKAVQIKTTIPVNPESRRPPVF